MKLAAVSARSAPDSVESLLRELVTEVRGLRADLRERERQPRYLTRDDRDRLTRLLPALLGCYGSEPFSSRDVVEAESPALVVVRNGLTVKALSKLFVRALDMPIDGHMVQKVGTEFRVMAWRVVLV
jgi:hypothetical protein